MRSGDIGLVRELIELQAPLRSEPLAERRRQYDRAERAFARGERPGQPIDASGAQAEWVRAPREPSQPVVLYMHGGGYSLGSTRSHRHLCAAIGQAAGAAVLSLDYRRAPESRFPAAAEDAAAAARWLCAQTDAPVVLAGDSAGGGLVVSAMIALRDSGERLPAAGVCLSPWLDLTCNADALTRLADRDPLLSRAELERMAAAYLQGADPREPLASPAFADLAGLPPLLVQVGSDELLVDDARKLCERGHAHGVQVTLEEWQDMIHVWQWYFPVLGEGREAIGAIAAFIERRAPTPAPPRRAPASRAIPASLIQQAHLLVAPETGGRGFLSWVYQLNGALDAEALARAVDEVVSRREILRVRLERHRERLYQVVTPFAPGVLARVDLSGQPKRRALQAAVEDVERIYESLSPERDPRFRAILYTLERRTSVLAMFVAEALVDSDSGSLLTADISRGYARQADTPAPAGLPAVSDVSYLDYIQSREPDRAAIADSRAHWLGQARQDTAGMRWPPAGYDDERGGATIAYALEPAEWAALAAGARRLGLTPYVLVLSCLQAAVAQLTKSTRTLVHAIVPRRDPAAAGIIGNFHSIARIATEMDVRAPFVDLAASTAAAVALAIEHSVLPAPLAADARARDPSARHLPDIRFYLFASHEGPWFAGVRRRRFRLHAPAPAPLSLSCVYAPASRQDFVFSSTALPESLLRGLAARVRGMLDVVAVGGDEHGWFPPSVLRQSIKGQV